jgi:hypothetical protein
VTAKRYAALLQKAGRCLFWLLTAPLLLLAAPSYAGIWSVSYSSIGTTTWNNGSGPQSRAWTGPGDSLYTGTSSTLTAQCSGTVTATLTWKPFFDGDNPVGVHVVARQSGTATWSGQISSGYAPPYPTFSGTADNGLNSPTTSTGNPPVSSGGRNDGVRCLYLPIPPGPPYVITLPAVNMNATLSISCPQNTTATGTVSCSYSVVAYNDHPHPTNFHQTAGGPSAGDPSVLHFEYHWDSTDGVLANLYRCQVGEIVIYTGQGNPISTTLPNPPWDSSSWTDSNPTINDWPATLGGLQDNHYHGGFTQPYTSSSFSGIQYYRFHCDFCMPSGEYETLMGPLSIDRFVEPQPPYQYQWEYRITKSGYTAYLAPLP